MYSSKKILAITAGLSLLIAGFVVKRSARGQASNQPQVLRGIEGARVSAEILPAGGNTIGGPGFFLDEEGGNQKTIFFNNGPAAISACITVFNIAQITSAELTVRLDAANDDVAPGFTQVFCKSDTNFISLGCGNLGGCRAFWRIDEK